MIIKKYEDNKYYLDSIHNFINLCIPSQVLQKASYADLEAVRLDAEYKFLPNKNSLRRILVLTDSICSLRIDGKEINHKEVFSREFSLLYPGISDNHKFKVLGLSKSNNLATEAVNLANLYHWYHKKICQSGEFTLDDYIKVYERMCEDNNIEFKLRDSAATPMPFGEGYFYPPSPDEIVPLLKELFDFCNSKLFPPTILAGLAHFYLELIQPFPWAADRMGRLLAHGIYTKHNMWNYFIFPIGVLPAISTKLHAFSLKPYLTNDNFDAKNLTSLIFEWICYCTDAMKVASHFLKIYNNKLSSIHNKWHKILGDVREDAAIKQVLSLMPTNPIFNLNFLVEQTGKSYNAINNAVNELLSNSIISQVTTGNRNRIYISKDVIDFLEWMENQTFPKYVSPRNAYYKLIK